MTALKTFISSVATLSVLLCAFAFAKNAHPFITSFGRRAEYAVNTRWAGHGSFNNERCWTEPGIYLTQHIRAEQDLKYAYFA
jgi:hypothetical protein